MALIHMPDSTSRDNVEGLTEIEAAWEELLEGIHDVEDMTTLDSDWSHNRSRLETAIREDERQQRRHGMSERTWLRAGLYAMPLLWIVFLVSVVLMPPNDATFVGLCVMVWPVKCAVMAAASWLKETRPVGEPSAMNDSTKREGP